MHPTRMIVAAPYPGSAPFHEEGSVTIPSPRVDTYQTKVDEDVVITAIIPMIPFFACRGTVFPVA